MIIIIFYFHRPSTFLKAVYVVGNLTNHASKNRLAFSGCTETFMFIELFLLNGIWYFQVARWFFNGDHQSLSLGCSFWQSWWCPWRCIGIAPHIVFWINILIILYPSEIVICCSEPSGAGKNKQTLCRVLKLDCSGIILSLLNKTDCSIQVWWVVKFKKRERILNSQLSWIWDVIMLWYICWFMNFCACIGYLRSVVHLELHRLLDVLHTKIWKKLLSYGSALSELITGIQAKIVKTNYVLFCIKVIMLIMPCRKLLNLLNRILEASTSLCTHSPMDQRSFPIWHSYVFGLCFSFTLVSVFSQQKFHTQVTKPLLETSRKGYLAAISASSYSFVSLLKHFLPIMNPGIFPIPFLFCLFKFFLLSIYLYSSSFVFPLKSSQCAMNQCYWQNLSFGLDFTGGASISLTYIASERIIPGYTSAFLICSTGLWFLQQTILGES